MAQFGRKKKPLIGKRGMEEFHRKEGKKTLKEKVIGAARYVKARAQSPEARERRKKVYGALKWLGSQGYKIGERIAEGQEYRSKSLSGIYGAYGGKRKRKTKRTKKRK